MTVAAIFHRPPTGPGTDRELLRRFADRRDDAAFAALVHRYGRLVFATCLRVLLHRADAEDAYQAAFLVLARRAGAIRSEEKLAGWLHTVAVRTATEVRRMRDRRRVAEATLPCGTGLRAGEDSSSEQTELASVLDEELAKLPDHYRLPVVLCELNGVSRKVAAAELGIAEGTLSSRLAKVRKLLADRLSDRGFAGVSAGVLTAALTSTAVARVPLAVSTLALPECLLNVTVQSVADTVVKAMYATKLKAGVLVAMLMALTGGVVWTTAAGAGPGDLPAQAKERVDPTAELVAQLGSKDFAEREVAEKKLVELGASALPAVEAGLKSGSPEVVQRCNRITLAIRKTVRETFAKDFHADKAGTATFGHPIWKRYVSLVGDSKASRAVFAELLKYKFPEGLETLDIADRDPSQADQLYCEHLCDVARPADKLLKMTFSIHEMLPGHTSDVAAYTLFLGSYRSAATPPEKVPGDDHIHYLNGRNYILGSGDGLKGGFKGNLVKRGLNLSRESRPGPTGTDKVFARLYANFLASEPVPRGNWSAANPFTLQLSHQVQPAFPQELRKEALPVARRMIADKSAPVYNRAIWIPVLRKYGDHSDAVRLGVLFADKTVLPSRSEPSGLDAVRVQVREWAIGTALVLRGKNPRELGFDRFKDAKLPNRTTGGDYDWRPSLFAVQEPDPITTGFVPADAKDKVLKAAIAWLDGEAKKEKEAEQPKKDDPAEPLVRMLGSRNFAEREKAEGLIRELGAAAYLAVQAGLKNENPEIVRRCQKIMPAIRAAWLGRPESEVWKRFVAITGDSQEAKDLFRDMVSHPDRAAIVMDEKPEKHYVAHIEQLFKAYLAGIEEAWELKRKRVREQTGRNDIEPLGRVISTKLPTRGAAALLFYLGTLPETARLIPNVGKDDRRDYPDFLRWTLDSLRKDGRGAFAQEAQMLFAAWLGKRSDGKSVQIGMDLARTHEFAEALPVARAVLADEKRSLLDRTPALHLVGILGTKDDVALVKPFLDEKAAYFHSPDYTDVNKAYPCMVQVRDVAHAVIGKLLGAEPLDLGYEFCQLYKTRGKQAFKLDLYLGFTSDEKRQAAHGKVRGLLKDGPEQPKKDDPMALAEQLGSKDFAEREAAEKKLKALGAVAYPAVQAGLKSSSPEVVQRCQAILPKVRAAWLARPESEVWKRFTASTGDTAHAKELFVEMASDQHRATLLTADKFEEQYAAFIEPAVKALRAGHEDAERLAVGRTGLIVPTKGQPTRGDATMLLFLGSLPGGKKSVIAERDFWLFSNYLTSAMGTSGSVGKLSLETRKLFAAWLSERRDEYSQKVGLSIACSFEIAEALPVARAVLVNDRLTLAERTPALFVFGAVGGKGDLDRVWPFLECDAVFHETNYTDDNRKRFPLVTQVRDVAHGVVAKLLGGEPADLGFEFCELYKKRGAAVFKEQYLLGFTSDDKRKVAHAKVRELLKNAPVPKAIAPPRPKKLPKVDPPSAELRKELSEPSVLCTAEMIGKLEARAVELAKKFPAAEDRARVYQATAKAISNGRLREDYVKVKAFAEKALALSRDPVTRWKARSLIASAIYITGKEFTTARQEQAEVLLTGYVELLVQDLPDKDPEWPNAGAVRNGFGDTPAEEAEATAKQEANRKAREEVEFVREQVFGRKVLVTQLRDLYKPQPKYHGRTQEGPDELRALAAKKMTDREVKTLMTRVLDEK